ncbi:MAG: hypothetical protein Q4A28_05045 [Brachymonas sp.]|nr:hypothetical protein [Brachymonas sp.]
MSWVICINNEGYEASLERRKLYQVLPDAKAESKNMVRVVDESGDDYLYSAKLFEKIEVAKLLEQQLMVA